jgi:hypothetical protein
VLARVLSGQFEWRLSALTKAVRSIQLQIQYKYNHPPHLHVDSDIVFVVRVRL